MPGCVPCPLCAGIVRFDLRYPEAVCDVCADLVTDEDGRALIIGNRSFSGGLLATYSDGTLPILRLMDVDRPIVCVRGTRCVTVERRFGGITIQVFRPFGQRTWPECQCGAG